MAHAVRGDVRCRRRATDKEQTNMRKWNGWLLCAAALILALLPACAGAEAAENELLYSDIIAGIDWESVAVEGDASFFRSVMSDGTVVRFEGHGIVVGEEGITVTPGGTLTSLDAIGRIYTYQGFIKDGESEPINEQGLDVGYGFTNSPDRLSMERAEDIFSSVLTGYPAFVLNGGASLSVAAVKPNFVFVRGAYGNTVDFTLTSLTVGYDPSAKYTDIAEARAALPEYFNDFERFFGDTTAVSGVPQAEAVPAETVSDEDASERPLSEDEFARKKLAEDGALFSDIVAGIDPSSVAEDGDVTFFRSVMSDGTAVWFEGTGISVTAEGIVMNPGASLTSLDAVGKIYQYGASVGEGSDGNLYLGVDYGYTFSADKVSVERAGDVYTHSLGGFPAFVWNEGTVITTAFRAPNFVSINAADYNSEPFTLTGLTIGYNPAERVTAITAVKLYPTDYGYYMEGEPYNAAKETKANAAKREYDFYLMLRQEPLDEAGVEDEDQWLYFLPVEFYEVGDLKDAGGSVLDKQTARVHAGDTLDVTIGDYTFEVELPMAERYEGAQTLREARPYSTLSAVGSQHALVIPMVWADQTELVSDELYALYQKALGRLIDERGVSLGDFSDAEDGVFSLTEYFDIASYGQLELSSFMTDWYYTDKTFAGDYEYIFPEVEYADEVLAWVKATYPNMDWTQFDQDGDGTVDSIVLISVGLTRNEGYMPASFGGAVHSTSNSFGMLAGTQADPQANCFLTVNHSFLKDGETDALIHEFSHSFGLNDYYDGSGTGINAVGGYDMQGNSVGDWNAYSKLAVGWIEPQVVSGLVSGESVELTLGSLARTGDVILLPAAGTEYDGPFGEYVMLDLLSPDGVNAYDAAEYKLEDTVGVRISHVNASLRRTTASDGVIGYVQDTGAVIGMELHDNNYTKDGFGLYNLEVIQAGGENTFTNLEKLYPYLRAKDLFYAGDSFAAEDYDQFFYQGQMDSGLPLGYTVTILDIDENAEEGPIARVRITAN